MKNRGWIINSGLVLASVLLVALCFEAAVRIIYGSKFAPQPSLCLIDDQLGWKHRPDLDQTFFGPDFSMTIRTDSQGHRLGRLGMVPPEAPVILAAGDSNAFGWGVGTEEALFSRLDELTARERPGMRVVNLGVNGYGTIQGVRSILATLDRMKPGRARAVLFLHEWNDVADNPIFVLIRAGLRRPVLEGSRPTWFHGLNFFLSRTRHWYLPITTNRSGPKEALHQVHWSFPTKALAPGTEAPWAGRDLLIEPKDVYLKRSPSPESLTANRIFLLKAALAALHQSPLTENVPILHFGTHHLPDWYEQELGALISETTEKGRSVFFAGRVDVEGFEGPFANSHSGGHFTPAMNTHYAKQMFGWLKKLGLLDGRRKAAPEG